MARIEHDLSDNSSIAACVFVAAVTVFTEPLPSNDSVIFTEPLSNNDREYTYTQTVGRIYEVRRSQGLR
jgi:hypothetical protein